jgi:hypothetical protein
MSDQNVLLEVSGEFKNSLQMRAPSMRKAWFK